MAVQLHNGGRGGADRMCPVFFTLCPRCSANVLYNGSALENIIDCRVDCRSSCPQKVGLINWDLLD